MPYFFLMHIELWGLYFFLMHIEVWDLSLKELEAETGRRKKLLTFQNTYSSKKGVWVHTLILHQCFGMCCVVNPPVIRVKKEIYVKKDIIGFSNVKSK